MVSRTEFRSALDNAQIPLLGMMSAMAADAKPNVEVSDVAGYNAADWGKVSFFEKVKQRLGGQAKNPSKAVNAIKATMDSLERRLAKAVSTAGMIAGSDLQDCIAQTHLAFDAHDFPASNRFGLMSPKVWDTLVFDNEDFFKSPAIFGPNSRVWGRMIWMRNRHLDAQAAIYHSSAVEGGIEPFDPKPGKLACAYVGARVINPDGVRVLRWDVPLKAA